MGLARTASLVDGIRAESTNSILLDNGDFLQGNPMGDYMAYERGDVRGVAIEAAGEGPDGFARYRIAL